MIAGPSTLGAWSLCSSTGCATARADRRTCLLGPVFRALCQRAAITKRPERLSPPFTADALIFLNMFFRHEEVGRKSQSFNLEGVGPSQEQIRLEHSSHDVPVERGSRSKKSHWHSWHRLMGRFLPQHAPRLESSILGSKKRAFWSARTA